MTPKMKKILIATSILGALAIVATAVVLRMKKKALEQKLNEGSKDIIASGAKSQGQVVFPIKKGYGSTDAEKNVVKVIQRWINSKISTNSYIGYSLLKEDGVFGTNTENALRRISAVTAVSYTLYKQMSAELAPKYISASTSAYEASLVPKNYSPIPGIFDL